MLRWKICRCRRRRNNVLPTQLARYVNELISGDDERAEAATARIAALDDATVDEILSALQRLLRSDEADSRWWATRTLAEIEHPRVSDLLVEMLADESSTVRGCAALGLRYHPTPAAVPALTTALSDSDRLYAGLAADALVQTSEAAVLPLVDILAHGPQTARLLAVRALAKIGDTRAIPALFAALDDDSALVEYWAAKGLEDMGVGMVFFEP